jgi:drug/metabolite transporter (DMT)-like permease
VTTAVLYSVYILMLRSATRNGATRNGATRNGATTSRATASSAATSASAAPSPSRRAPIVAPLFEATVGTASGALVLGLALRDFRLGPAWPALGWLVVLALTSQVIGWLLITMSMPKLPAWLVSSLLLVQPVGSLALGALFLGERPSPVQLAGVAAILTGVLIAAGVLRRRASNGPGPAVAGREPATGDQMDAPASPQGDAPAAAGAP